MSIFNFFFMKTNENPPVPKGLKKCGKCGEYYGKCIYKDHMWKISCKCNPHICSKCGKPVYPWRICSNYYEKRDGTCWHIPIYCAWGHRCPDGKLGQLENSHLIDVRTGEDLLHPGEEGGND